MRTVCRKIVSLVVLLIALSSSSSVFAAAIQPPIGRPKPAAAIRPPIGEPEPQPTFFQVALRWLQQMHVLSALE